MRHIAGPNSPKYIESYDGTMWEKKATKWEYSYQIMEPWYHARRSVNGTASLKPRSEIQRIN